MRVIITRPQTEAAPWLKALDAAGYSSWSLPLIAIRPSGQAGALASAWQRLADFDAVMFVSRNAVHYFFEARPASVSAFNSASAVKARAWVTGPGSYSALQKLGAEPSCVDAPDFAAGQFDSEALWSVVRARVVPGYRVLIVRGATLGDHASDEGSGRDWLAAKVRDAGGEVEFVVSYERECPQWDAPTLARAQAAASDGSVWVFSSSEAIRNLQQCCPDTRWEQALAVVTHARIGDAARAAGFGYLRESKPLLPALMASIESLQ